MVQSERTQIRTLQKRGSGLCVVVPAKTLEALGWNRDDALQLAVVSGSLVVTRIELPKIPDLRQNHAGVTSER